MSPGNGQAEPAITVGPEVNVQVSDDTAELVLRLACLTEDREPKEERALVDLAFRIDQERNKQVVTNHRTGPASDLIGELGFELDAKRQATRERRLAAWQTEPT